MIMAKKKIPEVRYRSSRICRVLGNPTAYEMLSILKKGSKTPEQLANILGVTVSTVSQVLRSLREIDVVRYEVKFRKRVYWIKYKKIVEIMSDLEDLIDTIGVKET